MILNDQLDLAYFLIIVTNESYLQDPGKLVEFRNFAGFDFNSLLAFNSSLTEITPHILLFAFAEASDFDFYLNDQLIYEPGCRILKLEEIFNTTPSYTLLPFSILNFKQVKFKRKWCSIYFRNAHISTVYAYNYFPQFEVSIGDDELFEDLNINIGEIQLFRAYKLSVSRSLLHPQVYSKLTALTIEGSLLDVDSTVFKHVRSLKTLTLKLNNLRGFMQSHGLAWMRYINNDI